MSEEAKQNCRKGALNRTIPRTMGKSHIFIDKKGREFRFDSSWEDVLAIRLDELNLNWERGMYVQLSKSKYFPDFYLPDFNVYLDQKNSAYRE